MENKVFAKAAWRIVPFMMLLYVVNFLDRVNVGFASLTMDKDLGVDAEAFGLVGGMFFIGYFFFEIPSNVILEKVGARLWICRIMLTWGIVSMATAWARGVNSLLVLRFLLGVTEAGFFPGMILYLTYWFPGTVRARFVALFLAAIPFANVIGGPLSTEIMARTNGMFGAHGWQWLFLIEGLPSCVLAVAVFMWLPDGPQSAPWLSDEEKAIIADRLAADPPRDHHALLPMLRDVRVWLLTIPDFLIVLALYGVGLWLPQIVHAVGFSNRETGFVLAALYTVSILATIGWSASSDYRGERIWHIVVASGMAAAGLIVAAATQGSVVSLVALVVAAAGIYAAVAVFWTLPSSFLGGTAAAGGIALINSFANLGGFLGPFAMGWLLKKTGTYAAGMSVLAVSMIGAAIMILVLGRSLSLKARAHMFDKYAPPV
jgi:ACS family tartrate transporter-like MFS transporter